MVSVLIVHKLDMVQISLQWELTGSFLYMLWAPGIILYYYYYYYYYY